MSTNEIAIESRLSLIPVTIEKLRSDPELRSRIAGREAALCVAVSEALAYAIAHGNRSEPSKKVYFRWICEPDGAVSILVRDEGAGFNPEEVALPKDAGEDRGRGIPLMRSCMDEIRFPIAARKSICARIGVSEHKPVTETSSWKGNEWQQT
jgi:two-component sensor histidine kinase